MPLAKTKPQWLNKKINLGKTQQLHNLFKDLGIHTVCREAHCPNIGECFSANVATFLVLGNVCTRNCKFCAVSKGTPAGCDVDEARRVATAVKKLELKYVVITSVTRDDLNDGGAAVFADTITVLKQEIADLKVEVLVPDFSGSLTSVETVLKTNPDVLAHNLETVPELYPHVREQADYARSLAILKAAKKMHNGVFTKSGVMLGLGETEKQLLAVFRDLRNVQCDFLSLGQYLAPSKDHYPVKEYISPQRFETLKTQAMALGFKHIESGPYVRSSYIASEYFS